MVAETFLIARITSLNEIVHIKLAHEGRKVVVFKVLWQHFLCKLVGLIHNEAVSFVVPIYGAVV